MAKGMRSIDHLLFMDDLKLYGATKDQLDSLIHAVNIYLLKRYQDFIWTRKVCCLRNWEQGKKVDSSGIVAPGDQNTGEVEEEGYRYLSILKLDQTLNTPNTKMKGKTVFV